MKLIQTKDAVGHILCHDITQIIKDVTKGVAFKKGHVVTEEDIPKLLSLGKENLYIWESKEGFVHENDAAQILFDICKNESICPSEVKEGKIEAKSEIDGILEVNVPLLNQLNMLGEMMIATRHSFFPVKKGDVLAAGRIIPLTIEKEKMDKAIVLCQGKHLLTLHPFRHKKIAIITTGSEVFKGRIKDTFGPVIRDKVSEYPSEVMEQIIVDDQAADIVTAIKKFRIGEHKTDLIICTGGMSVDPDDVTPTAIQQSGAKIIRYGAPVLPGAMFLMGYFEDNTPIVGLPGCVMYAKRTIFDLILPLLMADKKIDNDYIGSLGHGGLCLSCDICTFPQCGFGR